ncbi:MAG: MAPEG family protein [Pseudanabaena sp. SU_2_4]|nr:MAPEG family protein [Pseudanabaena sp. SU_2_4]
MNIPLWVLLGFAGWTLAVLLGTIGVYRWSRILTGRAQLNEFPADIPHGDDWYRRAMRSHANCLENLPIYTAIVVVIVATDTRSSILDILATLLLVARIMQTIVHIGFRQSNMVVGFRFSLFFTQLICMIGMGITVAMVVSQP